MSSKYKLDMFGAGGKIVPTLLLFLSILALSAHISSGGIFGYSDFSAFHNAANMAQSGYAVGAYDLAEFQSSYRHNYNNPNGFGYGWFYPPHLLVLVSALAEFDRVVAKLIWLNGTFAIYLYGMSKLVRRPEDWLFVVFLPAAIINLFAGQTGFLTTGLLALFVANADRNRPSNVLIAGVSLAFLTIKPHLWVALPLLVLLRRQYAVLVCCLMTIVLLVLASVIAFGTEAWVAMLSSVISGYEKIHDGDVVLLNKMSTIAALSTVFGFADFKLVAQLIFLAVCAGLMVWLAKRNVNADLLAAFAIVTSFLAAPHNMVYDHTILIVPIFLAIRAVPHAPIWGRAIILVTFLFPYLAVFTDFLRYFPFGALTAGLFWTCLLVLAIRSTSRIIKPAVDRSSSFQTGHPTTYRFP